MYAVFFDFAQAAQAKDLKTTGVGENGPLPAHELMQAAQRADPLVSRTKIEVVGIPKDDLRAQFLENVLGNGFDRSGRTAGHESRRFHRTMRGVDPSQTGRAVLSFNGETELHTTMLQMNHRIRRRSGYCFQLLMVSCLVRQEFSVLSCSVNEWRSGTGLLHRPLVLSRMPPGEVKKCCGSNRFSRPQL